MDLWRLLDHWVYNWIPLSLIIPQFVLFKFSLSKFDLVTDNVMVQKLDSAIVVFPIYYRLTIPIYDWKGLNESFFMYTLSKNLVFMLLKLMIIMIIYSELWPQAPYTTKVRISKLQIIIIPSLDHRSSKIR